MIKIGSTIAASIFVFGAGIANSLPAGNYMWADYTTSKDCGSRGIYVGPNKPEEHGGVCLYHVNGPFRIHSSFTTTKTCNDGGIYAGVARSDLHGGHCLWFRNEIVVSSYTTTRNCLAQNGEVGVYVGPNQPAIHGGTCLYVRGLK